MIYSLNTSRRIEAATRLNQRFSKSRLMLCSPRIKGSWLYSGCSTWVPRSTALAISSSSGDVRNNGRTSEISVVECGVPQGSVLRPLYFVLFTADVFGIADEHGFAIHRYADDMQIYDHCVVDNMHHLTSRLVDCIGSIGVWMTNNRLKLNASKTRIHLVWFGSSCGQVYIRVDCDQRVLHSSIQDTPQPRSHPGSVSESGISRHQADKYIVLSHTSAAHDPSNAHQWCMPRSHQGPCSFEAGLLQWAPCQSAGLSFGSTVRCDACCCIQTHPPATSKKSHFWRHLSPVPLAWHLGACSFQTMRSRASVHSWVGSFIPV